MQRKEYDVKGKGRKSKTKAIWLGMWGRSQQCLIEVFIVLLSVSLSHTGAYVTKKQSTSFKEICYSKL